MAKNVTSITNESPVAIVTEPKLLVSGFDYTQLDHGTADFLREAATLIRSCKETWARAIIRIGMTLRGAKAHLPHGHFGAWLKAEFNMSERTAENYMSVERAFGSKSETVADLPPTLMYKLAAPSTPRQIREKVVADLEAGKSIDQRAVSKDIAAARIRKTGALDKLRRAEKAAQLAAEILAKLPPDERHRLLRLLAVPGITPFLDDEIRRCETARRARSGDCQDSHNECKAASRYTRSIHDDGGPDRLRCRSMHEA
jgi:hypothetical protein